MYQSESSNGLKQYSLSNIFNLVCWQFIVKYFITLLLFCLHSVCPDNSSGQQGVKRKKFYAGVEMGTGLLMFSRNNIDGKLRARYALGFSGGYIPFRALKAGINLNGYLIESFGNFYSNPEKGISISNTQIQLQLLPFKGLDIFANLQGGWSVYTNHHPDEYNSKGISGKVGVGYGQNVGQRLVVSLVCNFSTGKFNDVHFLDVSVTNQHFNAFEVVACLTYK